MDEIMMNYYRKNECNITKYKLGLKSLRKTRTRKIHNRSWSQWFD
jgi:hypothetical protein